MNAVKNQEDFESRRKSSRRNVDNFVYMIDGRAYPVYNWGNGGVMIHADDRLFSLNSKVDITLKFRLSDKILDIAHHGRVLRKMRDKVVVQFDAPTREIQNMFNKVVDDTVTREFVESQLA